MTKFVREGRYIVFKISHLDEEQLELIERVQRELPTLGDCVVVESDWPEYEKVWEMIEERVNEKGSEMNKPTSGMWSSSYTYDWIIWCGWRIRQEEFTDVRQALHKIMRETKGTINPKWISGWFCPACEGTKVVVDHSCLNCYGKGIFDEYMNEPLVKPKKNKVELELDWQDVRKAAEGGNKAFEKWLEGKQNE